MKTDSLTSRFPRKEHYDFFVKRFAEEVAAEENICFYLYGSYTRGDDFVPGRSDIDGGFIIDSEFLLPRTTVLHLARRLDVNLERAEKAAGLSNSDYGIKTNFNLMDRGINRDGRFLAYDETYAEYLKKRGTIAAGPNLLREMNGVNYRRECLNSAAHNLRKVRNGLLTYFVDLRRSPETARKHLLSSMNVFWSMPKKLLEAKDCRFDFDKDSFFKSFRELLPEYDPSFYNETASVRKNPRKYFEEPPGDSLEAFTLFQKYANETERMIQTYVNRFPHIVQYEVKTN